MVVLLCPVILDNKPVSPNSKPQMERKQPEMKWQKNTCNSLTNQCVVPYAHVKPLKRQNGKLTLQKFKLRNFLELGNLQLLIHLKPKVVLLKCNLVQLIMEKLINLLINAIQKFLLKKHNPIQLLLINTKRLRSCLPAKDRSSSSKLRIPTNVLVFAKKVSSMFQSPFQMESLRRVAYKPSKINMDPIWV